jgi:hypothetical protein
LRIPPTPLSADLARRREIGEAGAAQQLGADAVGTGRMKIACHDGRDKIIRLFTIATSTDG